MTGDEVAQFGALIRAPTTLRLPAFGVFHQYGSSIIKFDPLARHLRVFLQDGPKSTFVARRDRAPLDWQASKFLVCKTSAVMDG